jgi:hypothetical protein
MVVLPYIQSASWGVGGRYLCLVLRLAVLVEANFNAHLLYFHGFSLWPRDDVHIGEAWYQYFRLRASYRD